MDTSLGGNLYIVRKKGMNYELLFPAGYKQDFRELMEYIDSQFEKLSSENDSTFNLIIENGGEY